MLHNEARHLIIQALNHHTPVKEIAECFSVNTSTIYRLRKQLEMTGSVETRTSHAKAVKNLLEEKHVQYLYLPPYSPDYNPIEQMWSKIKANMRKQKVRATALLPEAIGKAFSTIRISDCIGWFHACGYVQ